MLAEVRWRAARAPRARIRIAAVPTTHAPDAAARAPALTRAPPRSVPRLSTGPRVSLGANCVDAASFMGWSRQSGSPAVLPRAHPAPAPPLSLSVTFAVAPGTPYSDTGFGPPYSLGAPMSAARAAALAACASPRALGDVPLLLSEQRSEAVRLAPPQPPAHVPARATMDRERRTRNSNAGMAALADASANAANAANAAEKAAHLPRCMSSFGADSKWGFERNDSDGLLGMHADGVDMEFD